MSATIAYVLVLFVALMHIAIAVTEIFFWNHSSVHSRLDFTVLEAQKVAPIVANAGLYNGFIAAGLIWGLTSKRDGRRIESFFLACVIIAGLFGAVTLKWTTLLLQTLPGVLALLTVWMARPRMSGE